MLAWLTLGADWLLAVRALMRSCLEHHLQNSGLLHDIITEQITFRSRLVSVFCPRSLSVSASVELKRKVHRGRKLGVIESKQIHNNP